MAKKALSEAFAVLLRRRRTEQGLSQTLLAEKAGIHYSHVSLIERAERNPSLDVSQAIASALGLKLSALIIEAEELQEKPSDKRKQKE